MKAAREADLEALYAASPDPWSFRTSAWERAKHARTAAALARPRYRAILEVGCGNGELARRLAPRANRYVGLDASARALAEAARAVPSGEFVRAFLPAALPPGPFDGIVLSEILYFLDAGGIADLAARIGAGAPNAEVLAVNYRRCGPDSLGGDAAVGLFADALPPTFDRRVVALDPSVRIDRFARRAATTRR